MKFWRRIGQLMFVGAAIYGLSRLLRHLLADDDSGRRRIQQRKRNGRTACDDPVDLASCESFPASDPPAYNAGDRIGRPPRS